MCIQQLNMVHVSGPEGAPLQNEYYTTQSAEPVTVRSHCLPIKLDENIVIFELLAYWSCDMTWYVYNYLVARLAKVTQNLVTLNEKLGAQTAWKYCRSVWSNIKMKTHNTTLFLFIILYLPNIFGYLTFIRMMSLFPVSLYTDHLKYF